MARSAREERRNDPRMLCSDLVTVRWVDASGRCRQEVAILEDISTHGVCLQLESEVPAGTAVEVVAGNVLFRGKAQYSQCDSVGRYIGVQMDQGFRWELEAFRPGHLFDPRTLLPGRPPGASRR
jgi:hypothetical protein